MTEKTLLVLLALFGMVIPVEVLLLAILSVTALARGPNRMQTVLRAFFVLGFLTSFLAAGLWLLLPQLGIGLSIGPSVILWFIALLAFTGAAGFLCWGVAGRVASVALLCSAIACTYRFLIQFHLK